MSSSYLPPGWTLERLQTATVDDLRQVPEEVSNLFIVYKLTDLDP